MVAKYIKPDTNKIIKNLLKNIIIENDEIIKECDLIDLLIKIGIKYINQKDIENLIDKVDY